MCIIINLKEGGSTIASNYLFKFWPDGRNGSDDDVEAPVNPKRHSFKAAGGS